MISPSCKVDEHELCAKHVRRATGKLYCCSCDCHPLPIKVERVIIEEDDDD